MTPTERLLHLATVLDSVPAERFDLAGWGHTTECGFAGCAVGWAAQDPVLQAEGLRLEGLGMYPVCNTNGLGSCTATNWGAVQHFFCLTQKESEDLFSSDSYFREEDVVAPGTPDEDRADAVYNPTPVEVAARIRAFVQSRSTT